MSGLEAFLLGALTPPAFWAVAYFTSLGWHRGKKEWERKK